MAKITLEKIQNKPSSKFSVGGFPGRYATPDYMVCSFNEQFEDPVSVPYSDGGYAVVVSLRTGKIELMEVSTEIWLFT